jgi:hypothetical protein
MRHVSAFLAAALPALIQAAPYGFSVSGDEFVRLMSHQHPMTDQQYAEREKAYAYLDGVKDAEVGKTWCPDKPHKTFELAYDAADHIKTLPADERRTSAAALLLVYLSNRYPCKGAAK